MCPGIKKSQLPTASSIWRSESASPSLLIVPIRLRIDMDWTALLANACVADSPGRSEAVEKATTKSATKARIKLEIKKPRGSRF